MFLYCSTNKNCVFRREQATALRYAIIRTVSSILFRRSFPLFTLIQRLVGFFDPLGDGAGIVVDAVAEADGEAVRAAGVRFVERAGKLVREIQNGGFILRLKHCRELVAAVSCNEKVLRVLMLDGAERVREAFERFITLKMTVNVVDGFEIVDVHENEDQLRRTKVRRVGAERIDDVRIERIAVIEVGQAVARDLIVEESHEHDDDARGDTHAMHGDRSARCPLHRPEKRHDHADEDRRTAHFAASDRAEVRLHLENDGADHAYNEGNVLQNEAYEIESLAVVHVLRVNGIKEAEEAVRGQKQCEQNGRDQPHRVEEDILLPLSSYMKKEVEQTVPQIADERGQRDREEHGGVVHDLCEFTDSVVEQIAEHICNEANDGAQNQSLQRDERRRVRFRLQNIADIDQHRQAKKEIQNIGLQKYAAHFANDQTHGFPSLAQNFTKIRIIYKGILSQTLLFVKMGFSTKRKRAFKERPKKFISQCSRKAIP